MSNSTPQHPARRKEDKRLAGELISAQSYQDPTVLRGLARPAVFLCPSLATMAPSTKTCTCSFRKRTRGQTYLTNQVFSLSANRAKSAVGKQDYLLTEDSTSDRRFVERSIHFQLPLFFSHSM